MAEMQKEYFVALPRRKSGASGSINAFHFFLQKFQSFGIVNNFKRKLSALNSGQVL